MVGLDPVVRLGRGDVLGGGKFLVENTEAAAARSVVTSAWPRPLGVELASCGLTGRASFPRLGGEAGVPARVTDADFPHGGGLPLPGVPGQIAAAVAMPHTPARRTPSTCHTPKPRLSCSGDACPAGSAC